jgi:murein DD-endopeptidase MepM/ murein hydrolase activator NlpD
MTRTGEDDYNPGNPGDDWDPGNLYDLGGGFYYDGANGLLWVDYNGDGTPDGIWIDPVPVTPPPDPDPVSDPPEEYEPPVNNNGGGDSGGGGGGGGGVTVNRAPCNDVANGKANPLVDMALAPPVPWNIAGATFGWTRTDEYGDLKLHKGIDLAGPVGTPIYAQFNGIITGPRVNTQPNRIGKKYPSGYSGDRDGAGNRISITSTVGGKTVTNSYWHLRAGDPFGINPRTESPWALGDLIYAGEIIGYIGITGNAGADVPHLHLKTTENGDLVNPTKYLNATVSPSTATIATPCD